MAVTGPGSQAQLGVEFNPDYYRMARETPLSTVKLKQNSTKNNNGFSLDYNVWFFTPYCNVTPSQHQHHFLLSTEFITIIYRPKIWGLLLTSYQCVINSL